MRLPPRFWAAHDVRVTVLGRELLLAMWGWSDVSVEAASDHARSRVEALVARGGPGRAGWDEYYPVGPVREPVLAAFDADGSEVAPETPPDRIRAFLTRTRYGAIVLNTDAVVVVDVDLPEPARATRGLAGIVGRWLGGARAEPSGGAPGEAAALERIRDVAALHPHLGLRTYRTRAGFRVLVTGSSLRPTDPGTGTLLADLGSDPLYARLCSVQQSFRARLTPKPWRIGSSAAALRWPFPDAAAERAAAAWIARYDEASRGWAVCSLVDAVGAQPSASEQAVIRVHDAWTMAPGLPLA